MLGLWVQEAELQRLSKAREQELSYKQQMDNLEVEKQKRLAQIESERFSQLVHSLGSDTLKEMARAGPEMQVRPFPALRWSAEEGACESSRCLELELLV